MNRVVHGGLLLLSCVFLLGMGGLGSSGRISVPEPAADFAATVTDQSDVMTRVERASFDGQTAIAGQLGKGRVSIGFEQIASMHFVLQDRNLMVEVSLKDGGSVAVALDKGIFFYGKLPYGELKIAAEDIRAIKMHGEVSKEAMGRP